MRLVIVGGGFGGVRLALNLANKTGFDIKLIADKTYFEYHAALYRSATGRSPLEVAIPLADFFSFARNIEVVQDQITQVSLASRTVSGQSESVYHYDNLVLAVGSVTHYFGIQGLAEYSYGVKTIHEALELKRHLHDHLVNHDDERHYVVIGGGATGVELAAELSAYLKQVRRHHRIRRSFQVDLIEAADRLLPALPTSFTSRIQDRLRRLGVRLYLNTPVKAESLDGVKLPQGEIKSHTVVWTAGVANNPLFASLPEPIKLAKNGRVQVDQYLQAAPGVYVIGDSAATQYSGMAQTALHDANFVSRDLLRLAHNRPRRPYHPERPIYAIPVGPSWSAVLWGRFKIYGPLGWVLRRLADLRLYIRFLPPRKALSAWRYGFIQEEICPRCR